MKQKRINKKTGQFEERQVNSRYFPELFPGPWLPSTDDDVAPPARGSGGSRDGGGGSLGSLFDRLYNGVAAIIGIGIFISVVTANNFPPSATLGDRLMFAAVVTLVCGFVYWMFAAFVFWGLVIGVVTMPILYFADRPAFEKIWNQPVNPPRVSSATPTSVPRPQATEGAKPTLQASRPAPDLPSIEGEWVGRIVDENGTPGEVETSFHVTAADGTSQRVAGTFKTSGTVANVSGTLQGSKVNLEATSPKGIVVRFDGLLAARGGATIDGQWWSPYTIQKKHGTWHVTSTTQSPRTN